VKKILIVDDETSFLLSLQDGLRVHRDKFEVLTAGNGREAVDILRVQPIDLLVTDLKLPEMNGFELLAWTSRHQPQLPVIVMSAFGTPEIEERLAKMDTLQFLEKPLDLDMLLDGILTGLNAKGKSFIRGITLATFLQLVKAEKKNCTLKVTSLSGELAYLYIRGGELIDADYGHLTGLGAALDVVGWSDAEIEMDGVCRRQDNIVGMAMEHLLIEAFKRKDEAAENQQRNPAAAAPSQDPLSLRMAQVLAQLTVVHEFAIFDKPGKLLKKNSGTCTVTGLAPKVIESMLNLLENDISFGNNYRSVVFNAGSRNRYLLFPYQSYRVVTKLKPGTAPQKIIEELKRCETTP